MDVVSPLYILWTAIMIQKKCFSCTVSLKYVSSRLLIHFKNSSKYIVRLIRKQYLQILYTDLFSLVQVCVPVFAHRVNLSASANISPEWSATVCLDSAWQPCGLIEHTI